MVDKVDILYNEIVGLRKDIKDILTQYDNRISILESLKDKRPDIIVTPCYVDIDSYCPLPTGLNKVNVVLAELGLIPVVSTPDFDNLAKTYTDLTQKNLLLNDSLIQRGTSSKHYSCKPRIEIRFRYMKKFDTPYTKNKVEKWNYFKELKNKPDVDSIL